MFSPDIQLAVTANESDDRDGPIRDIRDFWKREFRGSQKGFKTSLLKELRRSCALEVAIAMVSVVENLEVFGLSSELCITSKKLPTEESPVIGIIEALHHAISPGLSNRNKNDLDPHQEAKPQDNPQGSGMPMAAMKTQFVVELKEIRYAHGLPTTNQG
jgi:hypothetical protein